jgi:hypothetical protein
MATKHDEKIKALELKLSQAKALRAKEEARAQAAEAAAKRTADNRRKLLAGACVLSEIEQDPEHATWLNDVLARRLTRASERALFGLAPLPAPPAPDPPPPPRPMGGEPTDRG